MIVRSDLFVITHWIRLVEPMFGDVPHVKIFRRKPDVFATVSACDPSQSFVFDARTFMFIDNECAAAGFSSYKSTRQ